MTDFISLLSFSLLPLLLITVSSVSLPPAGAVLSLRNEIMLALALPSVANAGTALGLFFGVQPEQTLLLYLFASMITFGTIAITELLKRKIHQRTMMLAALLAAGQITTSLLASLSQTTHTHSAHLLNGEILATGLIETVVILIIFSIIMVTGIIHKKSIYCWCADNKFFQVTRDNHRIFSILLYSSIALLITVATATAGTLFTTVLLIFPAFLADTGKGGSNRYFLFTVIIGVSGSVAGFFTSLLFDLPPSVCSSGGVAVIGVLLFFISKRLIVHYP